MVTACFIVFYLIALAFGFFGLCFCLALSSKYNDVSPVVVGAVWGLFCSVLLFVALYKLY